jgi:transketolase
MEEHQLNTGFGSMIVERLSDFYASGKISAMPRVHRVGIPNMFVSVAGTQEYLREKALLTLDQF